MISVNPPTLADNLYSDLDKFIQDVENTFVLRYLQNTSIAPDKYHVRAYCVICHAGFEDYFERIAELVLDHGLNNWSAKSSANKCLIDFVDDANKKYRLLIKKNHGAKIDNITNILSPLGINIIKNTIWRASLKELTNYRGEAAHTVFATVLKSPNDIKNWIDDCLKICNDIRVQANKILST